MSKNILMTHPLESTFWSINNIVNIEKVSKGSQLKALWRCPNGENHEFSRNINKFLNGKNSCPYCSNKVLLKDFNDLKTKQPVLALEFSTKNILMSDEVLVTSTKNFLWNCNRYGHEWTSSINCRVRQNQGCPYCSNNKILVGFNDLFSTHPEAIDYWDFDRNIINHKTVSRGSNKKVWWKNPICGHSFQKIIKNHNFTSDHCNRCPRTFVQNKNFKDECFKEGRENIVSEWNYVKNFKDINKIAPYSEYKAHWKCSTCNHEWVAKVSNRFKGSGCPKCSKKRSNLEKIVITYIQTIYSKDILVNKRPIKVKNKILELDIWLPDLLIAFEVQDFATHDRFKNNILVSFKYENCKNSYKKGPIYHENKRLLALEQLGVTVYDIWEDDIKNNNYKSIIELILMGLN